MNKTKGCLIANFATVPSEGVRWLVMKEPVQVSQAQIDAFKAVMHHPNNRPVQPLNGRLVLQ
ncbi:carbonic anhydrase family protein [Klebsiella quasipneumoniae]|uniref:carbonic anhydrase family protein n=1 Tax=Klebsiella quasipneumoniae TaxID=1463165 RepID=UPI003BF6CFA3